MTSRVRPKRNNRGNQGAARRRAGLSPQVVALAKVGGGHEAGLG
jgi:hypothetical protein